MAAFINPQSNLQVIKPWLPDRYATSQWHAACSETKSRSVRSIRFCSERNLRPVGRNHHTHSFTFSI